MLGSAPCAKCGTMLSGVVLTGEWEPDGEGGKYWDCVIGQHCPTCGTPLTQLHDPAEPPIKEPPVWGGVS